MTIILIAKASTLSLHLAQLQSDLRGVVPSGPPIRWDSRKDLHPDYLEVKP